MDETKKTNYLFALFYLIIFSAFGGFMPFINLYLQVNQHFSGAQLGTFTFCTLMVSVFIVPIWGMLGDKTGKYKLLLLISLGTSVAAAFIYSLQVGYIAVIISGIILEICRSGTIPLGDVQAVNFTTQHQGNYGFIRSMGSLGYVVGSIIVGLIVSKENYAPMFVVYISLTLLAFAIAFTFPKTEKKVKALPTEETTETPKSKGNFFSVIKNKHFLFICAISLMTGILMDSANSYAAIHMVNVLNGKANSASLFTVATALPEILLLGIIGKLFTKYGYKKIFFLNAVVLVIRYAVYAFSLNTTSFLVASLVHCLATGVSTVGNLGYLKAMIPDNSYGTAVSLYNAAISIGRAVYSLIFGYMLDGLGSTSIFVFAAVIMVLASIWIYRTPIFQEADAMLQEQKA